MICCGLSTRVPYMQVCLLEFLWSQWLPEQISIYLIPCRTVWRYVCVRRLWHLLVWCLCVLWVVISCADMKQLETFVWRYLICQWLRKMFHPHEWLRPLGQLCNVWMSGQTVYSHFLVNSRTKTACISYFNFFNRNICVSPFPFINSTKCSGTNCVLCREFNFAVVNHRQLTRFAVRRICWGHCRWRWWMILHLKRSVNKMNMNWFRNFFFVTTTNFYF